ncbi:MAG: HEAT repeat domain-containing protein [Candidatus Riflebacteria bacterium]|nr:HEAT repeat domain-containing protein [Candidatus Riflebacteria bacterium]
MDRFWTFLLVLDLAGFLLWDLLARADGPPDGVPVRDAAPKARPFPLAGAGPVEEPAATERAQAIAFLQRIRLLPRLSPREKAKTVEIARGGDPDLQVLAVEILTRFPDQHPVVLAWLEERDRMILDLVRQKLAAGLLETTPALARVLQELAGSPPSSPALPAPVATDPVPPTEPVGEPGPVPIPLPEPVTTVAPSGAPAEASALPGPVEQEPGPPAEPAGPASMEVIPEFAAPHDLFLAIQHLQELPPDIREDRAATLINAALQQADPSLRGAAVAALSRFPTPGAPALVRNMLLDDSEYVRGCAVDALCELERDQAGPDLHRLLEEEGSLEVLEIVLGNLARLAPDGTIEVLDRQMPQLPEAILPLARRVRQTLAKGRSTPVTRGFLPPT